MKVFVSRNGKKIDFCEGFKFKIEFFFFFYLSVTMHRFKQEKNIKKVLSFNFFYLIHISNRKIFFTLQYKPSFKFLILISFKKN
jgi:hypothetical protein